MRTERADYDVADAASLSESADRLDDHFRRYAGWLGRAIRKRFGSSGAEADDIVQEAYLRLVHYVRGGRDAQPRALLFAIAGNVARDRLRRARHQRDHAERVAVEGEAEAGQFEQLLLKEVILGLPGPLRDVLLLARFTPMSQRDIASHLGISVKTVEWRMRRALALCADALDR